MKMEYLTVTLSLMGHDADSVRVQKLNKLGDEGWRLVSVVADGASSHVAYHVAYLCRQKVA